MLPQRVLSFKLRYIRIYRAGKVAYNVRGIAEIHFLIQRPRFDTDPLWCLWIVMINANTTICAKNSPTNASGVALALEMTDVLLGGWREVHAR